MKNLSFQWVLLALLVPVLATLGMVFAASQHADAASSSNKGTVEVGFTGTVTAPNQSTVVFQRLLLNVVSVRLNPSTNLSISDSAGGWQTIPVPPSLGAGSLAFTGTSFGGFFGPNGNLVTIGQGQSEIQVDLNLLQQNPQIFNAAPIIAKTYHQVELVLDPKNPADLVPLCGQSTPRGEGCIVYPTTLQNPLTSIRAPLNFDVSRSTLVPLVLNVNLDIPNGGPTTSPNVTSTGTTGAIEINPTITVVPNQSSGTNTISPVLGAISGIVSNPATTGETVTAELSGTNQIVVGANVQGNGSYVLNLPAALPNGTLYDVYASGPDRDFQVKSGVLVTRGNVTTVNFTENTVSQGKLSGTVKDACATTNTPIQAATLQLRMVDPSYSPAPANCNGATPPPGCVVVASAATDEAGIYPLPVNSQNPAPFNSIPLTQNFTMTVTAAGYDPIDVPVTASGSSFQCVGSGASNNACDFTMSHGTINGTVSLTAANTGPGVPVLVMAEDSGTGDIENVTLTTIRTGQQSADFSLQVPDNVASFDLFSSVQDQFDNAPQQSTGHSIGVFSGASGSPACGVSSTDATLSAMDCVGNGSITGSVVSPDSGTSVALLKGDPQHSGALVQLMTSGVGPFGSDLAGQFAFCAPADSAGYTLQRLEDGAPVPSSTASVVPAQPIAAPSPCSGICDNGSGGTTCSLCTGTTGVTVP